MSANEQHQVARFVGGLRFNIKEKFKLQPFRFLSKAISLAETVEEMLSTRMKNSNRRNTWETNTPKRQSYGKKMEKQPTAPAVEKGKGIDVQEETTRKEGVKKGRNQTTILTILGEVFPMW